MTAKELFTSIDEGNDLPVDFKIDGTGLIKELVLLLIQAFIRKKRRIVLLEERIQALEDWKNNQ